MRSRLEVCSEWSVSVVSYKIDVFPDLVRVGDADKEDLLAEGSDVLRTLFKAEYRSLAGGARVSIILFRLCEGRGRFARSG